MSNELKRNYDGADAYMLEASEELHGRFLLDLADFTAFDSELDSTYATAWLLKINTALGYQSDNTVVSEQKGKTNLVLQAMGNCAKSHRKILYFAKKAFPGDAAMIGKFGKGPKIRSAMRSQAKMVEFMDEFVEIVDEHKAALLAQGCPQTTIDNVATVATAIRTLNTDQNLAIDGRPEITQERVIQLNEAYAPMDQVIEAAQHVYEDNPTKLGQYIYNPPIQHRPIVVEVDALAGEIVTLNITKITDNKIPIASARFKATGSGFLIYSAATPNSEPGVAGTLTVAKDADFEKTTEELETLGILINETTPYLNAKNTGIDTGHLKVTFERE